MTFCLAMKVKDGLVGVADTRVTSGSECITARKISVYEREGGSMFLMTSGLRAVRDKALTYFDEIMEDEKQPPLERLFKVTNLFAEQIRRVAKEDKESLVASGFDFNIRALVGGQMSRELPIEWMQPLLSQLPDRLAKRDAARQDGTPSMDAIGAASK